VRRPLAADEVSHRVIVNVEALIGQFDHQTLQGELSPSHPIDKPGSPLTGNLAPALHGPGLLPALTW
jgi:hypothetical protein